MSIIITYEGSSVTNKIDAVLTPMPLRRASTSSMFVGPRPTILQELQATFGTSCEYSLWPLLLYVPLNLQFYSGLNIFIAFVPVAVCLNFSRGLLGHGY